MACERAHGTAARYAHGPDENDQPDKGCRCDPCGVAATRTREQNRLAALQGRGARFADAAPVREHVLWLLGQGMATCVIAREAGVAHSLVTRLVRGRYGTREPMQRVLAGNADAVLSVLPGEASKVLVSPVGSQRRVRGLLWQGWPRAVIADRAGLAHQQVWRLAVAGRDGLISAGTAKRVRVATSRLWMADPVAAGVERWRVAIARKRAAEADWVSILAWDDIDDPDEVPDLGERVSREEALAEDAEELILGQGYTLHHAAERLGVSASRLGDVRLRARKRAKAVGA